MRASIPVLLTVLSLPLVSGACIHAQFRTPTADELRMTEDPKAPGAAAVYLNYEEVDDDRLSLQSIHARVKILAEKGKELGTVEVPYLKDGWRVVGLKARTIQADGTVIAMKDKPEDLLSSKSSQGTVGRKVFTLPRLEVGSILEYRFEIAYRRNQALTPHWKVQKDYPVRSSHYEYRPATSGRVQDAEGRLMTHIFYWARLPQGAAVRRGDQDNFLLDLQDVAAAPDEEWMPPTEDSQYRVRFYFTPYSSEKHFWQSDDSTTDFWKNAGKDLLHEVTKFSEPSTRLRAAVEQMVQPGDSDLEKARKIYRAVQQLDNTSYSRTMSETERKQRKLKEIERAEDVWAQKSGDSRELALLYLALLRAAGLDADATVVSSRDTASFRPDYISLDQLDATLVRLRRGEESIYLDPGEKMCPFRMLHWSHANAFGIGQSKSGPLIAQTLEQPYQENTTRRTVNLRPAVDGSVTGSILIALRGQAALRWRQMVLTDGEEEMKKRWEVETAESVPLGVEVHLDSVQALADPEADLVARFIVGGKLGTSTGKRMMLPTAFFNIRKARPFVNHVERLTAVDMEYPEQFVDQVNFHLPAGYTVEGTPAEANELWQNHLAYVLKTQTAPGVYIVASSLSRAFTLVPMSDYPQLRSFYQKVAAADQQQLVLTAAPARKGQE